ncbi:MAG: hypothetical protein ABSE90_07240 [Verrucomicrobiota bacterium]|jgi:hypothetical protein
MINLVRKRFFTLRAACGDPRDLCPLPDGGPLSATRCGIGPSSSKTSSATNQNATNQQVAVSGGGTAIGARPITTGKVSGKGAAQVVGNKNQVTTFGNVSGRGAQAIAGSNNLALTIGDKMSGNVRINSPTNTTSNVSNSNNRLQNSQNTTTNTTINNSGTSNYNTVYGASDDVLTAALEAVTHQGDQAAGAISMLADTLSHATATPAAMPTINVMSPTQPAPIVYVTTPAVAGSTTDQSQQPAATYTENTPAVGSDYVGGTTGLTQNQILLIVALVVVIGGIAIYKLS